MPSHPDSEGREPSWHLSVTLIEMFLASDRPGTLGGFDLWVSTRVGTADRWSTPIGLGRGTS